MWETRDGKNSYDTEPPPTPPALALISFSRGKTTERLRLTLFTREDGIRGSWPPKRFIQ